MPTRILVVDDQPGEITPVLNWLNQEGYEVSVASNGDEALVAAEQTQPDLMLIDNAMPGLSGVETCQRLRRNTNTAQIALILVTNLGPGEARAASIQAGANEFISRPIKLLELRDRINFILNPATVALGENTRLLEETCQAALIVLPCNLAWLLTIDDAMLNSRMIATDRGRNPNSAGEVFLRLVSGGATGNPVFPLIPGNNPLTEVVLNASPLVNITLQEIQTATGGEPLFRALSGLRMSHAHFLPLSARGQITGMLVLASKTPHDMNTVQGQRLITTLVNQASTVVENARLVSDLAARQEQMRVEQSFRKMVLDTMGDGLVVIDTEAVITYANNRLLRMTGYTRTQLYGQSVGVIFHPAGRDALVNSLKRQGRSTLSFFQQLITKSGQMLPVLMSRATRVPNETSESSTVLVLSDISEQKRREQELEWQSERLRALNHAAQSITSALTVNDAVMLMLEATVEIVQSTNACLFLRDDTQPDVYNVVAAIGPQTAALQMLWVHAGEGIAGRVIRDHHSALVAVVDREERQIERVGSSVIAVPLLLMDQVIGVLEGINKAEGQFVQDDLEILENLAASGSVAIENARLFGQMQRRMNELNTLLEASSAVSSTLEIDRVLELISRRLVEALNVVRCQVSRWDRAANKLNVMAEVCNAYWEPDKGPVRPTPLTKIYMDILQKGQPVHFQRGAADLDKQMQQHLLQIGMDSALLIPLRYEQAIIGMVELYSTDEQTGFTENTIVAVEKAIVHWRKQVHKEYADDWQDRDSLTTLYGEISHTADASWCIISSCEDQTIRSLREIGFVLYKDTAGVSYPLDRFMAMTYSLKQGAPVTLHPDTPEGDAVERVLMAQSGTSTGLIVPLLVRGESVGVVKLLDNTAERIFDIADISLCQAIANVLANALENAQLYTSLEKRANALQAAYDDLSLADKVKDDLIQNLSHELQTPLHQVIMQLDLLITDAFGPLNHDQREMMQSSVTRIANLGELIRDMVSISTLDTMNMRFEETALDVIVIHAVAKLQSKADKVGLQIVPVIESNLSHVRANPDRIAEALEQLIDNAIKFSPRAERKANQIHVRVDNTNSTMVQICVQDYGIGIPSSELERIFHSGYQVDGSRTRRFGGTGLGLALARRIIEGHGGKIWVESTINAGSRFCFSIPKFDVKFQNAKPR